MSFVFCELRCTVTPWTIGTAKKNQIINKIAKHHSNEDIDSKSVMTTSLSMCKLRMKQAKPVMRNSRAIRQTMKKRDSVLAPLRSYKTSTTAVITTTVSSKFHFRVCVCSQEAPEARAARRQVPGTAMPRRACHEGHSGPKKLTCRSPHRGRMWKGVQL